MSEESYGMTVQEAKDAFKKAHGGSYSVGAGSAGGAPTLEVRAYDNSEFPTEFKGFPVNVVRMDRPKPR